MRKSLLETLQTTDIIQGAITILVLGAWLYLIITQQPTPDALTQVVLLVVGFYFGTKAVLLSQRSKG